MVNYRLISLVLTLSVWVNRIREKRGFNRAVVALANKLLRIAWVIIASNEMYLPATKQNQ